jgi:NAD(P)-dependent dehydrogenase (short-subunit alcohol dehydrogenase family)
MISERALFFREHGWLHVDGVLTPSEVAQAREQLLELAEKGSIMIVSSTGGLKASPSIGAYNFSKAADFQLGRGGAGPAVSGPARGAPRKRSPPTGEVTF